MKVNLSDAVRVFVGRQTKRVYVAAGEETIEEANGTVDPMSPCFVVGNTVMIDPGEIGGYIGMKGRIECIYLSTDADRCHAYGVRVCGTYGIFSESALSPIRPQ